MFLEFILMFLRDNLKQSVFLIIVIFSEKVAHFTFYDDYYILWVTYPENK